MGGVPAQIHNYRILRKLEESNYAIIYKAQLPKEKLVVLKIARTPETNELITREFLILSQFKHPNIVAVFDYNIADDGRAYFIQEYIPEPPLNTCFKGYSEDFLGAIVQVANGLGAFHNKGFIHCDLKPEHILYDRTKKQAIIIDFGFSQQRLVKAGASTEEITLAGTMGYMAPEVLKGVGIDQRSDLYSLGVIIYEIIARTKPKDPYEPIKGIPEEINKLISRLVSKEPALRPSVPELYETLSKYLKIRTVETLSYKVALPETGFVELPEIMERLSSAKGETLIIQGDTGSGKTRLLQELKYRYLMKGCAVLYYLSREKAHLHEALQSFITMKPLDMTGKEDKFQIFEEITEALITYAKDKQVIIMVDDLEGLSDYSLRLFRYIGYGLKDTNIVLLGTSHGEERITALGFETLALRPFNQEETQTLLDKTFFEIQTITDKTTQKPDFAHWLHTGSGGNPLFVVEILRLLYEYKIMFYHTDKWQIKVKALKKTILPSALEDLLESRLNRLSTNEMQILKILALANTPLPSLFVGSIVESDATIALERFKNMGLVREEIKNSKRAVVLSNQIVNDITLRSVNKKERNSLSKKLIKAIESSLPHDKDYAPILAQLYENIGNCDKAYDYFQQSAHAAEGLYDYDAAIKYYEKMANYDNHVHPTRYPETLLKIADTNQIIGDNTRAIEYYDKVQKSKRKDLLAQTYFGVGRVYSAIGGHKKAVKVLKKATALLEKTETQDYIRANNRLAYSLLCLHRFEAAEHILSKALRLSKKCNDAKMMSETLYYQAVYEYLKGNYDEGIEKAKENLEYAHAHMLLKRYAYAANLLSSLYRQKGDIEQAQQFLEKSINTFKKMRLGNAIANTIANQASLYILQGDLLNAKVLFENALTRAHQTGSQTAEHIALSNLGLISNDFAKFDDAIIFFKQAIKIEADDVLSNYHLALAHYRKAEIEKARSILKKAAKVQKSCLYDAGLAFIELAVGEKKRARHMLEQALNVDGIDNLDVGIKTILFFEAARFYYETRDFQKSCVYAEKAEIITPQSSKEHIFSGALKKVLNYKLNKTYTVEADKEIAQLKNMGCIYDYAYLRGLVLEARITAGVKKEQIKHTVDELTSITDILNGIGAVQDVRKIAGLREKLTPTIIEDYSQRMISNQYLDTLSKLAELISSHLGDENFAQNILDLVIKATNAERGALFLKTLKVMKFVAGRNIDATTIKDASELSRTAIRQIGKNRIVFARDALSDPEFSVRKSVMLHQIHSLLCIPLAISGNVVGALYVDSKVASDIFGPHDKDFLVTVSKILASVIEKSIAFQEISEENILLKNNIIKEIGTGYLMGKSKAMKKIYCIIEDVAQTNSPVLILGETGTGKGMLARLIHLKSNRQKHKFLTINCGTIPETLLESELFGHKKGAFTGAIVDKIGLLEEAQGGTIFLDEITNTEPSFQAKILEAIEEKVIRRVGETKTRNIDVRFFFATNRDLEIEVEQNRFRKDLFYRINVFSIEIPPLRERENDIPLLAEFFLKKYCTEINRYINGFSPAAMQALKQAYWPGNVRELQNVIERAVILAKRHVITDSDLGIQKIQDAAQAPLREMKIQAIVEALNATGWNIRKAAETLGINRRTIERYIKQYRIEPH